MDELDALAREALPLLEQANDHAGLAHVWNAFSEAAATGASGETWPKPSSGLCTMRG